MEGMYSLNGLPRIARTILSATRKPCIVAARPSFGPGRSITSPSAKIFGDGEFLICRVFSTRMVPLEAIEGGEKDASKDELGTWPVHLIWRARQQEKQL